MKKVEFIESNDVLKIVIFVRDSLHWILPMLIFSLSILSCSIVLDVVLFIGILKHIYTSLILYIMGVSFLVFGGYSLILCLFSIFGKEILIFDNHTAVLSYKKEVIGMGILKSFQYKEISSFVVSDIIVPNFTKRSDIWARCAFEYNGRLIKFGLLTKNNDATDIVNRIISHLNFDSKLY